MTTHAETARHMARPRGPGARFAALFDTLATWRERRRQRLALSALGDEMLRDIGLSRADVEGEVKKPFWMV